VSDWTPATTLPSSRAKGVRGQLTLFKQDERVCINCRLIVVNERMYWYRYQVCVSGGLINPNYEEWDFYSCRQCGPKIVTVQKSAGYFHKEFSLY